jgi:choline/glycine/proline betaine transport protein
MFIARISKGRTVREFILGVLLVPSIVTFLDFSF